MKTVESRELLLIYHSDAEAVERGHKAVKMIYQLTNRVPGLIDNSLLEKSEGTYSPWSLTKLRIE